MALNRRIISTSVAALLGTAAISFNADVSAATYGVRHVFSIYDLQTNLRGRTFGATGTFGASGIKNDPRGICGLPGVEGVSDCPEEGAQPFTDKEGIKLYPVNSKFGFNVVDFLGAQEKSVGDGAYEEGFVGDIIDDRQRGVKVSNAETDTYKVKRPMGTWCQGLGGTSIKCSTEHYSTMEHTLSCHEVIPYFYADPVTGQQAYLSFPDPADGFFECSDAALDDNLLIVGGVSDGQRLVSATPGDQMDANDNTTVLEDIAVSSDYSITLKDDGKPLYRWGGLIKRPNDIRFYARIPLPESWKEPGVDLPITSATLYVTHWITNNPNDQIRPEDLENEAATGRKPSYQVEASGDWTSLVECYEGDGDYLPTEEGSEDPQPVPTGTVLKNADFALDPADEPGAMPEDNPYAFSSDLVGAFSNAFYTTVNRDPFEWSYVAAGATDVFDFVGSAMPKTDQELLDENLELVSGPRWRLKSNKFGQDIPGLEIPLIECSAPPYGHGNIRYEVGTLVTTAINLLDWDEEKNGPSPLSSTKGWVDVTANQFVEVGGTYNNIPYTTNGLPMTDDFDLAVYIKGDRKPTALYEAELVIVYDEPE